MILRTEHNYIQNDHWAVGCIVRIILDDLWYELPSWYPMLVVRGGNNMSVESVGVGTCSLMLHIDMFATHS